MSSNILMKEADSFSKTPSALIDKLINFTALNFFFDLQLVSHISTVCG